MSVAIPMRTRSFVERLIPATLPGPFLPYFFDAGIGQWSGFGATRISGSNSSQAQTWTWNFH